jgi:D-glycerate 3-kinase
MGAGPWDAELVATAADALVARHAAGPGAALIAGIAGAQGTGKTTLARALVTALAARGLRAVALSLDDFYLTRAERQRLARQVHPLLATRGLPGTHDLALAHATLSALQQLPAGTAVGVSRFDKAADDRAPRAEWPGHVGPVQIVVFEGYCLGAQAETDPAALDAPINALERDEDPLGTARRYADEQLAGPYQALFARIDWLAFLRAPDMAAVVRWRAQQEEELRAAVGREAGALLEPAAVERFVQGFERITRRMLANPPPADLTVALDREHRPVRAES